MVKSNQVEGASPRGVVCVEKGKSEVTSEVAAAEAHAWLDAQILGSPSLSAGACIVTMDRVSDSQSRVVLRNTTIT